MVALSKQQLCSRSFPFIVHCLRWRRRWHQRPTPSLPVHELNSPRSLLERSRRKRVNDDDKDRLAHRNRRYIVMWIQFAAYRQHLQKTKDGWLLAPGWLANMEKTPATGFG
jgi:hypothetical protein